LVATIGLSVSAHAGVLDLFGPSCGDQEGCGEAKAPECAKPVIYKPCKQKLFTYQRKVCDKAPPSCKPECVAPAPNAGCAPKPIQPKCEAPAVKQPCTPPVIPCPACQKEKGKGCADGCGECCVEKPVCDADPCEIAELIFKSQTACYAKDRAKAIDELGDRFDARCNPEIMAAFIYALNDADERVREEAADEIGDQLEKHPCCCTKEVIEALTAALADCDKGVRREAKEALEKCGYEVVDNCGKKCVECVDGCAEGCAPAPAPKAPQAPKAPEAPKAQGTALLPVPSAIKKTSAAISSKVRDLIDLLD